MLFYGAFVCFLVIGLFIIHYKQRTKYVHFQKVCIHGLYLRKIHCPFIWIVDRLGIAHRMPLLTYRLQHAIQKIHGGSNIQEKFILYLSEMLAYVWVIILFGFIVTIGINGSCFMMGVVVVIALISPLCLYNDLIKRAKERDEQMLLELPELLNKIMLLVGAGETVHASMAKCVRHQLKSENPLYVHLRHALVQYEKGYSLKQSLEQFSRCCGIQEVSIFTTAILLNLRRGGGDFVLSLKDLSQVLWEKRKTLSRMRGEQAASKLVFPMVFILLVIMIMIGAPAFMIMTI